MQEWTVRERGFGKRKRVELQIGTASAGISLEIGKTRGTIYVSGWYDGMVGIEGKELPLRSLLELFPKATLKRAVKELL